MSRYHATPVDRLGQVVAVLVGLIAVAGIPAAMAALVGWPVPSDVPSTDDLLGWMTGQISTRAIVDILAVAAWLLWAYFMAGLVVEVVNATVRRGRPQLRLPLGGLSQDVARKLVTAVLLAGATTPLVVTPASTPQAPTRAAALSAAAPFVGDQDAPALPDRATVSATVEAPPAGQQDRASRVPATGEADERALRAYTVAAPAAGRHDCLWDIAERHLGDPTRWRELFALNVGRPQVGGQTLEDPDLVLPGWRLRMPADATDLPMWSEASAAPEQAPAQHVVTPGDTLWDIAEEHLGDGARYDELATAAADTTQPDGSRLVDPDLIRPGWVIPLPALTAQPGTERTLAPPAPPQMPAPALREDQVLLSDRQRPVAGEPARSDLSGASVPAEVSTRPAPVEVITEDTELEDEAVVTAPWMLTGLTGAGAVMAGAMFLMLRQRRRSQIRARRPGRMIAVSSPELSPVERTVMVAGGRAAPTVDLLDAVLRRLAVAQTAASRPMPALAAVELTQTEVVLHLAEACGLPAPWGGTPDWMHWTYLPGGEGLAEVDHDAADQPAPYPLLVTIGADHDGDVWLLNLEQMGTVAITGDPRLAQDLARHIAAELALGEDTWARGVSLDCVGIGEELATLNPERLRYHPAGSAGDVTAEAVAEAVDLADRADIAGSDVATARAAQLGEDTWPGRFLLVDAAAGPAEPLGQLLRLVQDRAGYTGTCVVLTGDLERHPQAVQLDVSDDGHLRLPVAGLDLVAVGLPADEARGCARVMSGAEDLADVEIPYDPDAVDGWRSFTNEAGAIRPEHTLPRNPPPDMAEHPLGQEGDVDGPAESVLNSPDEEYEQHAATTAADLQELAPRVPAEVRSRVEDCDPTLDADLAAWFSDDCDLPRLILLGLVKTRTRGRALDKRKPYYTELLAYLWSRPHGATPAEVAEAMGLTVPRARTDVQVLREWLGVNPRTGERHLPAAHRSEGAKARGRGVYQVSGLLVDADLFRRLRVRGQARGTAGIVDLRRALDLVSGKPFDDLREDGWSWMLEGDRLDQHMLCAVVDVAHTVATQALADQDLDTARSVAETALAAAPDEEIPRLDLAAVARAEGDAREAARIARDQICSRSDDGGPPMELPARTKEILARHDWLRADKAAG